VSSVSKASEKLSRNSSATKAKSKARKKAKSAAKHERGAVETVARAAGWVAGALAPNITPTRDLFSTIHKRRSHKRFKPDPVDPAKLHLLLDAAVTAPNHKMTEPWGFLVLGPRARHVYAECKARLKFGDHMGVDGKAKAEQLIAELLAVPVVIGVTQKLDSDPVRREEDYAAVFMAVQNLLLAGTAMGLGTKVHTGSILDDAIFRSALGLSDGERLVTVIHLGEPADELPPKKRAPAADKTRWLD
jgi:nitroreductase